MVSVLFLSIPLISSNNAGVCIRLLDRSRVKRLVLSASAIAIAALPSYPKPFHAKINVSNPRFFYMVQWCWKS